MENPMDFMMAYGRSMENPMKHMDDVEVSNVSIVIRVPLKIVGWLFHGKYHL